MRHSARILVVDDDVAARQRLVDTLAEAGFETAACSSATGAIRSVARLRPDLVILETDLPDGLGADLASRLRADGELALFFVTHDATLDARLGAFEAGADDYLVKPYVLDELLARMRALLRRTGRQRSLVTEVGGLVVDEGAHRVVVAGETVDMGATDFAVLAILARHAGQVLSKRRLLELVWGYDAVDENLVEVHVSTLRRRLGPDAAGLIQTVRGVGYVLRDVQTGIGPAE